MTKKPQTTLAKLAFRFVLTIGIVNLFADLTYEGARSIIGPFMGSLGASATVIGFVVGFGELLGYGLRSVSGLIADKTHKYWIVAFVGYAVNMLAVPALALAGKLAGGGGADNRRANGPCNKKTFRRSDDLLCGKGNRSRLGVRSERGLGSGRRDCWSTNCRTGFVFEGWVSLRFCSVALVSSSLSGDVGHGADSVCAPT